jgi:hypothetical protein
MDWHQRHFVLRAKDLQRSRIEFQHSITVSDRSGWDSHVRKVKGDVQ